MNVNISGGEPLIRTDILQILEGFRHAGMRFDLVSNGSLLTAEHAEFIAKLNRCNFVQLSFDGPEKTHDAARGKGAFSGAVRAIELLRRYKIPVRLRDTIGKHNLGRLAETAKIVFEELKLPALTTNCVSIENLCGKNPAGLELSIADLFSSIDEHLTVAARYPNHLFGGTGPLGIFLRWHNLYRQKQGNRRVAYSGCLAGCGASFKQMGVRADGEMVPCVQLPAIELGRINQTALLNAWRSPEMERLRNRRTVQLQAFDQCRECPYRDFCVGGCPAYSAFDAADASRRVCRFCLREAEEFAGRDSLAAMFDSFDRNTANRQ